MVNIAKKVYSLDELRPGEKPHQICVVLKDVPGALAKATKVLADANINIKTSSTFYVAEYPKAGVWSAFLDISKATKSLQEVETKLREQDVVLDVILKEPRPAPFESIHFPILHGSTRAVIMPIGMFWALWDGFERILKHSGLSAVLYDAGKRMGEHAAKRLREMFGLEGEDLIHAMAQAGQATGWAITEIKQLDFKAPSATIIVKDCFEAAAWRKKPYNVCHWTRGYLSGYMSTVFGKPVEAVEAKCMAKGDKYCEFEIKEKI
jgi:predicted hydrocarbon binding protein/predicted amino acid-binding ACT domain protein